MEAIQSVAALQMALAALGGAAKPLQLTHHSDRGIQYCSGKYVKLLQDNEISISMTESGDPLENAIAERVNGILKEEYLSHFHIKTLIEAKKQLHVAINLYNNARPQMSIGNLTPTIVHENKKISTKRLWKNYYKKQHNFKNQTATLAVNQKLDLII